MSRALESLQSAWERRKPQQSPFTNAYRLFGGAREGIADLVVDCLGEVAIFHWYEGKGDSNETALKPLADWCVDNLVKSVYLKKFVADRSKKAATQESYSPVPFAGIPSPAVIPILENGLNFLLRPYGGLSAGLFLDQRDNRKFLAARSRGKKVLNCFAYTCGFSVAAAKAGATVTSVDLSVKYLEWGKENFAANTIPVQGHRFMACDVFEFFLRTKKKGEKFDLLILDPPSFSRDKKAGVFSIEKDLRRLIEGARTVLIPGGELFLSSNYLEWDSGQLECRVRKVLGGAAKKIELPKAPADFAREANPLSQCFFHVVN